MFAVLSQERFEDVGESDADGSVDYCYRGYHYVVSNGSKLFTIRSYDDEPGVLFVTGACAVEHVAEATALTRFLLASLSTALPASLPIGEIRFYSHRRGRYVPIDLGTFDFAEIIDTSPADRNRMLYYAFKVIISALLIVGISEIAKRSTSVAALIAALPLTSLLAFIWLQMETGSSRQIAELSTQIFWLVIPSLLLFLLLPFLLRHGLNFWLSLGASVVATAGCYLVLLPILRRLGVGL